MYFISKSAHIFVRLVVCTLTVNPAIHILRTNNGVTPGDDDALANSLRQKLADEIRLVLFLFGRLCFYGDVNHLLFCHRVEAQDRPRRQSRPPQLW